MFVIVRDDLSPSQKAVQAVHAAAEILLKEKTMWNNGIVVCLKVSNCQDLIHLKDTLDKLNITSRCFFEPDIGNEITSLATIQNSKFKLFRSLQLL
jgi:peptidyl-tRNA hydrolase